MVNASAVPNGHLTGVPDTALSITRCNGQLFSGRFCPNGSVIHLLMFIAGISACKNDVVFYKPADCRWNVTERRDSWPYQKIWRACERRQNCTRVTSRHIKIPVCSNARATYNTIVYICEGSRVTTYSTDLSNSSWNESVGTTLSPNVSTGITLLSSVSTGTTLSSFVSAENTLSPSVSADITLSPSVSAGITLSTTVATEINVLPNLSTEIPTSSYTSAVTAVSPTLFVDFTIFPNISAAINVSKNISVGTTSTSAHWINYTMQGRSNQGLVIGAPLSLLAGFILCVLLIHLTSYRCNNISQVDAFWENNTLRQQSGKYKNKTGTVHDLDVLELSNERPENQSVKILQPIHCQHSDMKGCEMITAPL